MKQDWIARQLKAEVIVGAFLLAVFVGIGYFTIILSRDSWFAPKFPYQVAYKTVTGLREGDSVVVRGMPMGKIKGLHLVSNRVHVAIALEQALTLHEGYRARIVPTSVLGGHYLDIDEGPETNRLLVALTLLEGEPSRDLMTDATELIGAVKEGVVAGKLVENLAITSDKVRLIAERLEAGEGTIGHLLSSDDTLYTNLLATTESLRALTGRIEAGEGALGRLLAKDDPLYDDLTATVKSLRNVAEKLDKGEGVLGRLVSDKELGNEVGEMISEARAALDDMRESTPVVTFTSIFFGAF